MQLSLGRREAYVGGGGGGGEACWGCPKTSALTGAHHTTAHPDLSASAQLPKGLKPPVNKREGMKTCESQDKMGGGGGEKEDKAWVV